MGPNVGSDYARSSSTLETSPSVDHHQTTAAEAVVHRSQQLPQPMMTSLHVSHHRHPLNINMM